MTASSDGGEARSMHIRELETVLDAIGDYAIITLNANGTVTSWNHGSEAMR